MRDETQLAALKQWTPLIEKVSYKAAKRAKVLGASLDQDDFRQELAIALFNALEAYNPDNEAGAKFITFLHRVFYNEVNKLLRRDDQNIKVGYTLSGDSLGQTDNGDDIAAWSMIEDDSERSAENLAMDQELITFVRGRVAPEAAAVIDILASNNQFVAQQVEAYNEGINYDAEDGGIRCLPLDINFPFVCKMLGFKQYKIHKFSVQVKEAIELYKSYGIA